MNRWTSRIACLLVLALLAGCVNPRSDQVQQHYPLISAEGSGSNLSKVYLAENTSVQEAAQELAAQESPKEMSQPSEDQMFLIYGDRVVNLQRDEKNSVNTLIQIDSIGYAREHYSPSFLQTFLTVAMLQSVFGGGWINQRRADDYRGYRSTPQYQRAPGTNPGAGKTKPPVTSEREGSFRSPGSSSGNTGGINRGSDSSNRRYDGSTRIRPGTGKKPGTSGRAGSFRRRR
ncbi:DUF4247 domain-containing protein [Paenibacillus sp. FJAT-26967]|uniref:DUF4247 domain-containing protein n=1 Tax=Paenibacillus sp. FJAT-26967 TaxID=1729690 RepID=UPI000837CCA0|nr:DUF4247 domain-containing protein [Paenibacillus sp. FJAT-26967]